MVSFRNILIFSLLLNGILLITTTNSYALSFHFQSVSTSDKTRYPVDPRPYPKTMEEWNIIQKLPDPLEKAYQGEKKECFALSETPWSRLNWGDIVLGRGTNKKFNFIPYGYFRHAGVWHADKKRLVSATPSSGVHYETPAEWDRDYSKIVFLRVDKLDEKTKKKLTNFTSVLIGKPYEISGKLTTDTWYCSKIPWVLYKCKGIDLDSKKGSVITPDSIYYSKFTRSVYGK